MNKKLKIHDGDTPGKTFEVKPEYPKPKVATMSRTVCCWCKAPLVLKDDILVCSNTDCPACDEKYLHEELIRTKELLEIEDAEHSMCHTQMLKTTEKLERTRKALEVAVDTLERIASEECKYPIGAAAGTIIRIEQINETKGGKDESR